jgi:nicotinamidase/pyrazinamidase
MSKKIRVNPVTDAFLGVDITRTFMPGGGLPVPDGHAIVPGVIKTAPLFDLIWWTEDEHPPGHISLVGSYSGIEPFTDITPGMASAMSENRIASPHFDVEYLCWYVNHCIGTKQTVWPHHGLPHWAETRLHPDLRDLGRGKVFVKGRDPKCDSYSAFRDNLGSPTGLAEEMKAAGVRRIFHAGLAFNYCVGFSAKNAAEEGFESYVIEDITRSVPIPGTAEKMRDDLLAAGVKLITAGQLKRA